MEIIYTNEIDQKWRNFDIKSEIKFEYISNELLKVSENKKNNKKESIKPFLKWAGGKGQLLDNIRKIYPKDFGTKITKYAEPFVGGGAVLFDILANYELDSIFICDKNKELINTYITIRDNVEDLILLLEKYQTEYIPLDTENRKLYYYDKRNRFNELKCIKKDENIEKAAIFIFLNKTCFNGLYRVNKKGQFNVPMGSYKKPLICNAENLRAVSSALQNVNIICGDYKDSETFIDDNTFVYFDPPYRPLNKTSSFTSYTENMFDDIAQRELAEFVQKLDKKGAKIALSNSDPKNTDIDDNFFDDLYRNQNIKRIEATRMINSNANLRGKIKEILVTNY